MKLIDPLVAGAVAILVIGAPVPGGLMAQDDERAQHVYEIFRNRCFSCHGEKRLAGLDLRTQASLKAGSANGPVVVPHQPEQSRLYLAVAHRQQPVMPRDGTKLSDEDVETIAQWIEDGASFEAVEEAVAAAPGATRDLSALRGASHHAGGAPVLGLPAAARTPRHPRLPALAAQSDRRVPARGADEQGPDAVAARRSAHADPPRVSRSARPAADARGGRRLRQRHVAGRLAAARRSAARLAALRRALGAALARPRPLRRLRRLRVRRRSPERLALSRLRRQRVQQRQAVRPFVREQLAGDEIRAGDPTRR